MFLMSFVLKTLSLIVDIYRFRTETEFEKLA